MIYGDLGAIMDPWRYYVSMGGDRVVIWPERFVIIVCICIKAMWSRLTVVWDCTRVHIYVRTRILTHKYLYTHIKHT